MIHPGMRLSEQPPAFPLQSLQQIQSKVTSDARKSRVREAAPSTEMLRSVSARFHALSTSVGRGCVAPCRAWSLLTPQFSVHSNSELLRVFTAAVGTGRRPITRLRSTMRPDPPRPQELLHRARQIFTIYWPSSLPNRNFRSPSPKHRRGSFRLFSGPIPGRC